VQDKQVRLRTGRDRIGATLIIAELHEQGLVVKLFDGCADLPARKSLRRKVLQSGPVLMRDRHTSAA
jgi:hypothetical protein